MGQAFLASTRPGHRRIGEGRLSGGFDNRGPLSMVLGTNGRSPSDPDCHARCRAWFHLRDGYRKPRPAESNRTMPVALDQARIAISEAEDLLNAVAVPKTQHQTAHHIVESGTKSAAGHDATAQLRGAKKHLVARPRQLEGRGFPEIAGVLQNRRNPILEQHAIGLTDVMDGAFCQAPRQRRWMVAFADDADFEIGRDHTSGAF